MKERYQAKLSTMNERYAEKFPKAHEKTSHYFTVLSDVWQETFPNAEKKVQDKMSKRRERAKLAREWEEKQKDMTPEELAEMEEEIPEWKRGALVVASDDEEEEQKKRGMFGRMKGAVGDRINQTEAAQNFYQSEEYKSIDKARKEVKEFRQELREQIDASHSPVVQMVNQGADKIMNDTPCAKAIIAMQKYDPEFDLEDLGDEAMEIFQEFYCNFLSGNKEYLEMVTGGTASAICKASIELREKEGWRFRYEELLNCSNCFFQGGLIEERVPQFIYHIEVQEFDEKVDLATGERFEPQPAEGQDPKTVAQASKGAIMNNTYRMVLSRHEEPQMEVTGHYWEITEFYKIGESRMIA